MGIRLTGYKAGPDNCYPGHPDGGTDTSSGVPLDEGYATFAIPGGKKNAGRTNLKVGDIVLFTNNIGGNSYQSLGWATDIGGLPHGDIDIAKGALQQNLGLNFKESQNYVNGVTNHGDVSAEKIAHMSAKSFRNPNVVNEAISSVNKRIKSGELKTGDDIEKALQVAINDPENYKKADNRSVETKGGSYAQLGSQGDTDAYESLRGGKRKVQGDDYLGYLQDMMQEDPMMGFLLLIVAILTGAIDEEKASSLLDSFGNLAPDKQRKALDGAPEGYHGSFRGGTGCAAGYTEPAPDESKFNYALLDPKKFAKATIYPVKGQDDRLITSEFGPRSLGYGSKNHPACDLRAAAGMEVVSMFDGKVVKVGQMTVTVQNDNGTTTTYMHVDAKAKIGDEIKAGDTVATVLPKCSRSPYDPHLDVRTIDSKSGIYINPKYYMDYEKMGIDRKGSLQDSGNALYNPITQGFVSENVVNQQMAQAAARAASPSLASLGMTDQNTPPADTNPAKVFAMHNATVAQVQGTPNSSSLPKTTTAAPTTQFPALPA